MPSGPYKISHIPVMIKQIQCIVVQKKLKPASRSTLKREQREIFSFYYFLNFFGFRTRNSEIRIWIQEVLIRRFRNTTEKNKMVKSEEFPHFLSIVFSAL